MMKKLQEQKKELRSRIVEIDKQISEMKFDEFRKLGLFEANWNLVKEQGYYSPTLISNDEKLARKIYEFAMDEYKTTYFYGLEEITLSLTHKRVIISCYKLKTLHELTKKYNMKVDHSQYLEQCQTNLKEIQDLFGSPHRELAKRLNRLTTIY